jgi:hypothetical protein
MNKGELNEAIPLKWSPVQMALCNVDSRGNSANRTMRKCSKLNTPPEELVPMDSETLAVLGRAMRPCATNGTIWGRG